MPVLLESSSRPLACSDILILLKSLVISGIYLNASDTMVHTLYGIFTDYRPAAISDVVMHCMKVSENMNVAINFMSLTRKYHIVSFVTI